MYVDEQLPNNSMDMGGRGSSATGLAARSVRETFTDLTAQLGTPTRNSFRVWRTGFEPLDGVLGGGIRDGALALLAGAPSVGKTTFALQMARNVARDGDAIAVYLCFEHEVSDLLIRLLALEGELSHGEIREPLTQNEVRRLFNRAQKRGQSSLEALGLMDPRLAAAIQRVDHYRDHLYLAAAAIRGITTAEIERLVETIQQDSGRPAVLFVDYLQKMWQTLPGGEDATGVVERLKDLALRRGAAVVAISALGEAGLRASHLETYHLLGGPVLAYEADVILMLEEKADRISRVGFEYSPQKLTDLRNWVIASVVKNRAGRDRYDLEFEKRFAWSCFNPLGNLASDPLVDNKQFRE